MIRAFKTKSSIFLWNMCLRSPPSLDASYALQLLQLNLLLESYIFIAKFGEGQNSYQN